MHPRKLYLLFPAFDCNGSSGFFGDLMNTGGKLVNAVGTGARIASRGISPFVSFSISFCIPNRRGYFAKTERPFQPQGMRKRSDLVQGNGNLAEFGRLRSMIYVVFGVKGVQVSMDSEFQRLASS